MYNAGNSIILAFFAWMVIAFAVSSSVKTSSKTAGHKCSIDDLSNVVSKYEKNLQDRVLKSITFSSPGGSKWFLKVHNFRRNLLLWGHFKMDKNRNGFIEPSEAVTVGRWGLRGSRECKLTFVRQCNEDNSTGISWQEWLKCFKIQECRKTCVRGKLDEKLCKCRCLENIIRGQVVSSSGSPLRDVEILLAAPPYSEMARTNPSGHFTIIENCESLSYNVTKNGYIPERLETRGLPNSNPFYILLRDAECRKTCVRGKLDKKLCKCSCLQNIIRGQVVSSSGSPLRDVAILLAAPPYSEMARTNPSGHFTMIESCESLSYNVTKNGYIPERLETRGLPNSNPFYILLRDAEPPYIKVNPKSKTRIAGQSVNFTCHVEGTPPVEITWYHNGRPLREKIIGNTANLFIANVSGAEGLYTCKARNDYGSETSTPAELKIIENVSDTCNPTPTSNVIKLPDACRVKNTGENYLDVGQCTDEPCSQQSVFNKSCESKEDCCCGARPVEYQEKVVIRCTTFFNLNLFELYRVKECGCGSCFKKRTVIEGEVVGGPSQEPIEDIQIVFREEVVDTTNEKGEFRFVVPDDIDRLTVACRDLSDRFFDTTLTLPFQRGQTVFHRIALQEEDPPVTFDSSKHLRVPLGHSGDSMAELELPANNLQLKDGTPFKGTAKLRLSFTDPRNVSDVLSAPGDFTTVDESGSIQPLKTYGIVRMKVQDQNNKQLDLVGNMKLRLDADKVALPNNSSGEIAPWLWWLDEKTGRWRQLVEMRRESNSRTKRANGDGRFYIGDIPTERISVINIDVPWKRCYVRVQAYRMTALGKEPAQGVDVKLIGREKAAEEQFYGYTQGVTNKNGLACIPAWCDSNVVLQSAWREFTIHFWAKESYLIHLQPDKSTLNKLPSQLEASILHEKISSYFSFSAKLTSQDGPIFAGDDKGKCLDSSDHLTALTFQFRKDKKDQLRDFSDFGSRPPGHPLSWYTSDVNAKPSQEPKKCFARFAMMIKRYTGFPLLSVQSFTPDRKEMYGFSMKWPIVLDAFVCPPYPFNFSVAFACVEYRCSEPARETFLIVHHFYMDCFEPRWLNSSKQFEKQNIAFKTEIGGSDEEAPYGFSAPVDVSDGSLGLFSGPGEIAEQRCMSWDVMDDDLTVLSEYFDPSNRAWLSRYNGYCVNVQEKVLREPSVMFFYECYS